MSERLDGKSNKFSRFCAGAILVLAMLFMAFLLPMSLIRTTGMSAGASGLTGEIVTFNYDNFFLNVIVLAICVATVYIFSRLCEHLRLKNLIAALMLWTVLFGAAFVCSAKLQPSEDSFIVTFFARQAAKGDVSYYYEYFTFFPFQFGFVLYEELFFRLFGLVLPNAPEGFSSLALQGVNVLWTALTYYAVIACTGYIFKSEDVQKVTAILLFFFLPPVLFATYMYGNVPGLACCCTGAWMFLRCQARRGWGSGVLCAVFFALAVCLKLNSLIFFAAVVIVWIVSLIRRPEGRSFVLLALLVFMTLGLKGLPQRYYEARCGESFGSGVPMLGWMAMGVSEGQSCSGWYDTAYTTDAYKAAGYDRAAAEDTARAAIKARLEYFGEEPREGARFFSRKLLSQWNEPTYQGLWNNQIRKKYSEPGKLYELVCQRFARRLTQLMNYYQQMIFFGFTLGLALLMNKKDITAALFPLVVLGGLLYHLLFEAKSQYAVGYVLLMIPIAAYGIMHLSDFAAERSRRKDPAYGKDL